MNGAELIKAAMAAHVEGAPDVRAPWSVERAMTIAVLAEDVDVAYGAEGEERYYRGTEHPEGKHPGAWCVVLVGCPAKK